MTHRNTSATDLSTSLFSGPGEMRGRFRAYPWNESPLGSVDSWPASLRVAAAMMLASAFPMIVLWGPELIQLYNDGYREIMGAKHPGGFVQPTRECWPEAWDFNKPIYERVNRGETVAFEDVLIPIVRYSRLEDVYFTISYSPIWDEGGSIRGVLITLLETTSRIEAKRLGVEREQLLAQVQHERVRLADVFRQAPAFLAVLRGKEHVFELANDSYIQLIGHRDILGKRLVDALPEIREQGFVELLDKVLATGEAFHGREVPVLLTREPGGAPEERYVDFVYQALVEADGSRSGVVAHGTDVTEQVRSRQALQQSEGRLRDVFEQAPMAVAVLTGPDHVYSVVSPSYAKYLGGRPLLGKPFRQAVPEEGGQRVALLMDRVYETGEPIAVKEQLVPLDRDGDGINEDYLFDISYQPLRDPSGNIYAITSLSIDVTEQVRAREMREESQRVVEHARRQLEEIFAQAPVAIGVMHGPEHRFTLANKAYEAVVDRKGLAGKTAREAFPELEGQGVFEMLDQIYATRKPQVIEELKVKLKRGKRGKLEEAVFHVVYHPLCDRDDAIYGIVAIGMEVTEQIRSRESIARLLAESERANARLEEQRVELETANEQLQDTAAELEAQATELEAQTEELADQTRAAEAANKAKSEFLATMSHELRTPLNAIGGYADLLLAGVRGTLTEPQQRDIERMKRSGVHLLGLINSILNFAKLEAGEVEFDIQPVSLAKLVEDVEDLVAPQAAAKSLALKFNACVEDVVVEADTEKVRQVLLNLLSNAIKFTEPGGRISVSCGLQVNHATIEVSDTGRGIAEDQLERIFDPFVQVDRQLAPGYEGVGLGLAISRDLALGMRGSLAAASKPGSGSTFTLRLPRHR